MFSEESSQGGWLRANAGDSEQDFVCVLRSEMQVTPAEFGWVHIYT